MEMMKAVDEVYRNRENFIIIGLTGKTGAGISTVADILSSKISNFPISSRYNSNTLDDKQRSHNIIFKYFEKNWHPFFTIKVRNIITTYILECKFDEINSYLTTRYEGQNVSFDGIKDEFEKYSLKNKCLDPIVSGNVSIANHKDVYIYLKNELPKFTDILKNHIEKFSKIGIVDLYQTIGNNIRKYGDATEKKEILTDNIYSLAERVNLIIKSLRRYNSEYDADKGKDYFVIDSFRNPTEVKFFQERYSAFYLVAVNCPEEDRVDRLSARLRLSPDQIKSIDMREGIKKDMLEEYDSFLSQDVAHCIQIADIYINNQGRSINTDFNSLGDKIARYVSLIQHPGIVPPLKDELLMQIAYTSKLSSGCISRQVGAVVTNAKDAPVAIGWNNAPEGQTPCVLRCLDDYKHNTDKSSYSKYERENSMFRKYAESYYSHVKEAADKCGRNVSYCFKSFINKIFDDKNQVHTRSLHAEENAFLQISKHGGESVVGGRLFTTSSPCVLCAKKAYQLGIKEVVYIEPYPDITFDHIFGSGEHKINCLLFSGAIGSAYHKIYSPIFSHKDELATYLKNTESEPGQGRGAGEQAQAGAVVGEDGQ